MSLWFLSQGWFHAWIEFPLSILHHTPFTTTHEAWILHHIKLRLCPNWASKKYIVGKYLVLKTWVTIVSWFVINLKSFFPNMTRLKAYSCRNLIPPFFFFIVILFQLSQLILFLCWLLSPTKKNSSSFAIHIVEWRGVNRHSYNKLKLIEQQI